MGWPSKLTDRELKRDSLLMSCTLMYKCVPDVTIPRSALTSTGPALNCLTINPSYIVDDIHLTRTLSYNPS